MPVRGTLDLWQTIIEAPPLTFSGQAQFLVLSRHIPRKRGHSRTSLHRQVGRLDLSFYDFVSYITL